MAQTTFVASLLITVTTASIFDLKPSCNICCNKGEFMNAMKSLCEECPANRYMDETRHGYPACKPCTVYWENLRGSHHVSESKACSRFQDAEILRCEEGFYKDTSPQGYGCRPCPPCSNNQPGCCDHEGSSTEPNIRITPSPTKGLIPRSSVDPGSDPSAKTDTKPSTTQVPTTPAEESLKCETITLETCQRANLTQEKCFHGEQSVSCKECPGCKTEIGSSSEASLSIKWIIVISVLIALSAVALGLIIVCCYFKNKNKKYNPARDNENEEFNEDL